MDNEKKLLEIIDLYTFFDTKRGTVKAVNNVSYTVEEGKTLGVVGESGSGKSVSAMSILRLLDGNGYIAGGQILFNGVDLTKLPLNEMYKIRGNDISVIFQEPMTSLNPVFSIEQQLSEPFIIHQGLSKKEAAEKSVDLLREVKIPNPEIVAKQYPHQLSGGMRQRVMIAIAFACDPKILICDEPTTALDVTIQGQILDIIKNLQKKNQTSVIMITHDLGVVANIAQKIAVMYSGIIVESGTCEDIFYRPRHPYTWALIRSVPRLDLKNKQELATIPGTPPDLLNPPVGCPFCTRCSYCMPICKEEMPEATEFGGEHKAACWLHHPMAPKVEMPNLEGGEL